MILPKISVITPTLNTGDSIETALASVAGQSYKNIEHIIVDGVSKDKNLPIIRKYQKKYRNIRLLTEKDEGIYDAMNKGMELCTGDWLYFLGADDSFYDENVLNDLFEQGFFQEEQVVYGNVMIRGDAPWAKDGTIYDGFFTLEKLFRWNLCHQSIFYPRSVIKKVGYFNTKYKITSDWDYNVRCWAKYKFTFTDRIIAYFTTGGASSQGGDHSLHLDFPDNVIRYFDLDVNDENLYQATSPFYYATSRYRENINMKRIRELEEENGRVQQAMSERQQSFEGEIAALRQQYEHSDASVRAEHEAFIAALKAEHETMIRKLNDGHEQAVVAINAQHENRIASLTADHQLTREGLKNDYDQVLIILKTEHHQVIGDLMEKHDQSLKSLRNEQRQAIGELMEKQDQSLKSLRNEQAQAFGELMEKHDQLLAGLRSEQHKLVSELTENYDLTLASIRKEYAHGLSMLKKDQETQAASLKSGYSESLSTLKESYEKIIATLQNEHIAKRKEFLEQVGELTKSLEAARLELDNLHAEMAANRLQFREEMERFGRETKYLNDAINEKEQALKAILESYTWKAGKIILAPITVFTRKKSGRKNQPLPPLAN